MKARLRRESTSSSCIFLMMVGLQQLGKKKKKKRRRRSKNRVGVGEGEKLERMDPGNNALINHLFLRVLITGTYLPFTSFLIKKTKRKKEFVQRPNLIPTNLKQNEAQSARAESTQEGVN